MNWIRLWTKVFHHKNFTRRFFGNVGSSKVLDDIRSIDLPVLGIHTHEKSSKGRTMSRTINSLLFLFLSSSAHFPIHANGVLEVRNRPLTTPGGATLITAGGNPGSETASKRVTSEDDFRSAISVKFGLYQCFYPSFVLPQHAAPLRARMNPDQSEAFSPLRRGLHAYASRIRVALD